MNAPRLYDAELQMFREEVREPSLNELRFLRWLAEQGKLEHEPISPPTGDFSQLIEA